MPKNVIVIGAGFGGLGCAKTFADANDSTGVAVTVIDAKSWFTIGGCLLYTSPSPRDKRQSRMPSSA